MNSSAPKDELRKRLFAMLSQLYAKEVPLYDKLLETVRSVNRRIAEAEPELLPRGRSVEEISAERHGAIRLGRPDELRDMARLFACVNMFPVNFYNLADAGAKSQPVISTAFRPLSNADHRVFCSLLMPQRFTPAIRDRVTRALADRRIFSKRLLRLIEICEQEGQLSGADGDQFIAEAVALFAWRGQANDRQLYQNLVDARLNIAADIACFPNPHLNHLTPNSLDIDALYAEMKQRLAGVYANLPHRGMKDSIEGPPRRNAPILLRQTAYNALDEATVFHEADGSQSCGTHRARFGEIEQRGIALTPAGRELYDQAIASDAQPAVAFSPIPDDYAQLQLSGLAYFRYRRAAGASAQRFAIDQIQRAMACGDVVTEPIRYEDFLPVSAAGIFASNLGQYGTAMTETFEPYTQAQLESYMDAPVTDAYSLYEAECKSSLAALCSGANN